MVLKLPCFQVKTGIVPGSKCVARGFRVQIMFSVSLASWPPKDCSGLGLL